MDRIMEDEGVVTVEDTYSLVVDLSIDGKEIERRPMGYFVLSATFGCRAGRIGRSLDRTGNAEQ